MSIYSNGGFFFHHSAQNQLHPTSLNFNNPGLTSFHPGYVSMITSTLVAGASSAATVDILDVYASGHWGQGLAFNIQVIATYYGQGVDTFKVVMNRGGYATVTHVPELSYGQETGGSSSITAHSNTVVGVGTNAGQNVTRSTIQLSTVANYKQCKAVITICPGSRQGDLFDSASTQSNVATNRATYGGAYHFRTINLTGHPDRDTA